MLRPAAGRCRDPEHAQLASAAMGMDRAGLTFASLTSVGPDMAVSTARLASDLGYRSFWTAETTGPEAFSLLGAVGAAAPDLDLGTGVLALQLRTPMVVAMAGATLQALHPDREVLLGIGISSPVVTQRWHGVPYGERPLDRVREYVTRRRACLLGERVDFAGDFYGVEGFRLGGRLGERKPKFVVGALNPAMLRLAGELADGVLLNYLPATHVPWSVSQVRAGGDATVYAYVHAGVCERHEGIDLARRDLFSYAVVDSYARNFERAGFGAEVAEIRTRFRAGDRDGAVAGVSDRMVDAIDVMGGADAVHKTMRDYADAGVDVTVEADVEAVVERAEEEIGPIDLFASNAGILGFGGIEASDTVWSDVWSVNVLAHLYAARAVIPLMLARGGGYLLSTASAAGLLSQPGDAPYTVTKHAAVALAEWLAITYGDQGIKVSCVCPMAVDTALLRGGEAAIEAGQNAGAAAPAARAASVQGVLAPDQVAAAVVEGIRDERFLILPHPEVATFEQRRAADRDRWLAGMRRLSAALEDAADAADRAAGAAGAAREAGGGAGAGPA